MFLVPQALQGGIQCLYLREGAWFFQYSPQGSNRSPHLKPLIPARKEDGFCFEVAVSEVPPPLEDLVGKMSEAFRCVVEEGAKATSDISSEESDPEWNVPLSQGSLEARRQPNQGSLLPPLFTIKHKHKKKKLSKLFSEPPSAPAGENGNNPSSSP